MQAKIYSTELGERKVSTEAKTWGELKKELEKQGIKSNNMKAVIGETKTTMTTADTKLPTYNFTLFLMQEKTKAGENI